MNKILSIFSVFIVLFMGGKATAIEVSADSAPTDVVATEVVVREDPIAFLTKVTNDVLDSLKKNKDRIKSNPEELYNISLKLILPYADFEEMSRWVAGRKIWDKVTPEQKKRFVEEFQSLVLHTYMSALQKYTDEKIEFTPLKGSSRKNDNAKRIQISSKIRKSNGQVIQMEYRLINEDNGEWKVYDLIIEGISILKGFQAQFSEQIKQNGLASVTEQIRKHNQDRAKGKNA
jgi:phospholipid transport system substrate-binding protein